MSDRWIEAIVTAAVGSVVILLVRVVLIRAVNRYLQRAEARRPAGEVASMRTRLTVLRRVLVAALSAIVAWQVLSIFPTTEKLGTALLASSAVLALFAGLAFSVPLGNLGAGLLLGFTQPVRLGDRVIVGEAAGEVEQINLIYTVLITDEDRRIFIPNTQMVSGIVINRTIADPRRLASVRVPVALGIPIDRARSAVQEAAAAAHPNLEDVSVLLNEVTEGTVWLSLSAFAPPGTNVTALNSALREQALAALAREDLLPAR
jgi:small-conductance mechanosensitive channel